MLSVVINSLLNQRRANKEARAFMMQANEEYEMKHMAYGRTHEEILKALELYDWVMGQKEIKQPEPEFTAMEAVRICRTAYNETDAFIAGLKKHGYKIEKI